MDILRVVGGEFLVGEGGQVVEANLRGGLGDSLIGVGVGWLFRESQFGVGDSGDGISVDGFGNFTGSQPAHDAVKQTFLGTHDIFLGGAQGAPDLDAARIASQDTGQDLHSILRIGLKLLFSGGDLFLEPGIELGKGDFFHEEID